MSPAEKTKEELLKEIAELVRTVDDLKNKLPERNKIFSEATTEAIFLHEGGKIINANEAFIKLLNYGSESEVIGLTVFNFITDGYITQAKEQLQTKSESPFLVEGKKKGGETFIAEVTAKTIKYLGKEARVVLVRDVTIREQYQKIIVESEDRYKTLMSNIPAGLIIHFENEIVFLNDYGFEILGAKGAKLEDFEAPSIYDFILPEYHDAVKERIERLKAGEDIPFLSIECQTFDNRVIFLETKSSIVRFGDKTAIQTAFFDSTNQLKIQERLSENEEKLTQILTNIEDLIYYVDVLPDNTKQVKYISPQITKVLGISQEDYIEKTHLLSERCHPDDLPRVIERSIILKKEKAPQRYVYRFKHGATNEYIWIEERVFPRIEDGVHVGNFGITRNVNDRITYEEEITKTKEQLSIVLNNIEEIVYYLNFKIPAEKTQVVFINDKVEEILGVTKEEFRESVTRKNLIKRVHPDDVASIKLVSEKLLKEKRAQRYQYRFKHQKTDEYIWVEEWVYPQYEDGKHVGNFGVTRDISEFFKQEQQLKASEEQFRMLAENALDIVYRYSLYPEPKYEYVSRSAEHITGYKAEDFYANPLLGFDLIHPDDRHMVQSSREIIESKHRASGTTPKSLQIRWIKKDGTIIWTETLNKIIADESGKVIAIEGISRDITERKIAEEELKRSEQKFVLLSNSAPIGIFLSDERGVPYYANKKLEEITGLSLESIINKSWFKHIHPDDAKTVARRVRDSVINEIDFSEEFRVRNLLGAKWIKFQATTVWSVEKKLIGWVGTIEDISKRKEDQEKIIANELRYRQLFENNMAGVYRVSLEGKIIECNQAFADIFEYQSPDELKNINSINLYFDTDERERYIAKLNVEKRLVNYQLRLKTKKNREIIVLVNAALTFDRETGFYCNEGTLVEITSSVKSEKALKESERALSTLMSNLPGMAYRCLYDENWTMLFVSSGCLDLTGYKSEELLHNEHTTYSDIVHPQDKFVGREQISQSLKTRKPFEIEYRIINKAGEVRWVWEKGEPVFDENKNLLFLEGFITDVTDRKEYEGRIKQNNENYKSVFENIPDGILIHDFNNIIQFINPAALKIFGIHSIKELKSHLVQDNIHPSKIEMALERRRLVASGQQVPFVRTIVNRQNGESLEVESRISLINYEGEKAFLVVWRDTSTERELEREQIRAEAAEQNNKKLQQEVTERRNAERNLRETQKYTRMLIDSSIDMICATDREGLLTEFNPAAQKVFGYKANEVMGKHVSMLYSNPDDRKAITNDKLYKDGAFAGEVINKKKDGTSFPAFLSASVLKDESGNIIGAMGVSRDITEIKKTEQNIKASEERYRAIYNQAYIAIAQIDREGNFLQVNDQLSKIIGYSSKQLLLKNITDLTHPDDRNKKGNKNKAFIIGEKENTTIEKRYIHSSGAIVFASVTMSIVRDEKNKPDYAIVVIQDITEKKKADRQIKTQAAKLNAIIESSSHHIWTINGDMALTSFNRNYSELMHRRYQSWVKIGDNIVSSAKYNSSAEYNNYWQKKYKEAFAGKSQQFEASFIEKNGTASWLEVYLNPIVGADGAINEVSGIGHDITEKKISEEQIRQSLKEKEVLLKEVHHRVKNNIQVISSILNLQSSYVKDANTINMLKECQNRIKSMAFIHESLYQTKDFSKINFQEYLTKLVQNLVYSYEMQNSNIKLNTEVDNIMLNLDQSIPCGLIVNELISNALKYAFKGRKRGEINVEVKQGKDDYISITVADNGVGLPEKFDYKNTDSLGLQLVVTLTEQLSGNIKLFRKKGTKFTIAFKHQPVKSRI